MGGREGHGSSAVCSSSPAVSPEPTHPRRGTGPTHARGHVPPTQRNQPHPPHSPNLSAGRASATQHFDCQVTQPAQRTRLQPSVGEGQHGGPMQRQQPAHWARERRVRAPAHALAEAEAGQERGQLLSEDLCCGAANLLHLCPHILNTFGVCLSKAILHCSRASRREARGEGRMGGGEWGACSSERDLQRERERCSVSEQKSAACSPAAAAHPTVSHTPCPPPVTPFFLQKPSSAGVGAPAPSYATCDRVWVVWVGEFG